MLNFSIYNKITLLILIIFPLTTNSQIRNLNEIKLNQTIRGEKKKMKVLNITH